MTGGIMIAAAAYLWKRWRKKEAVKTAVTLFALVALYPSWPADQWRKSGWDTSPPCCCPRRFRPACSSTTHTKCQLVSGMSLLRSQRRAGVPFITAARHFQGRAGVSFITAARFFKGEQVCLLLQPHGISKGEQVCRLLQPHHISKGEQVCPLLQPHGISKGEQVCLLLQPHGISKGEQVCLLLQPLCCGWFFSGVAGDGTVVLGPDGGVSTGTSRCPDRPDRDGVTAAGITVP